MFMEGRKQEVLGEQPQRQIYGRISRMHVKVPGTQQESSTCQLPPEKCPQPLKHFFPSSSVPSFGGDSSIRDCLAWGLIRGRDLDNTPQMGEELSHGSWARTYLSYSGLSTSKQQQHQYLVFVWHLLCVIVKYCLKYFTMCLIQYQLYYQYPLFTGERTEAKEVK